ncbi:cyclin-dependent kinase 11B-like isoform X2 [Lycorma delicatula]|uniref:cyclin-dependent kinase 11B-like isoform X2 n=1 Tax=Lycorma delicatula TaxID=130591 RepID=UPI003F518A70
MSDDGDSDVLDVDDQCEDGEIKKSSPLNKKERSDSSASMSEEDTADSLEIKPPQAHVHKSSSSHGSRRDKHSSSRRSHVSSSHRKGHHHSRSHRDERRRHHRDRVVKEELSRRSKEERGHRSKDFHDGRDSHKDSYESRKEEKVREEKFKEERFREEKLREERLKEERLKEEKAKQEEEQRRLEAELREKLEKKRNGQQRQEKERERQEREMRRERLLEAERVKEAYRRDTEERRLKRQDRERSRSRERAETEAAAAAASASVGTAVNTESEKEKQLEEAGLVVLSDESMSPALNYNQKEETSQKDGDQSDGSHDDDSSDDSDSSTDSDQGDSDDDSDIEQEESPPIPPPNHDVDEEIELEKDTLPPYLPAIQGCRSVEEFQCLNRIEEGTYGVVYRARDKRTDEIVALKRLKMEKEKEGFPITSLREINTLLKAQHPNIVTVREIVVGSNMDKIFIVMDYVEHDLKSLMETMKQKKQVFIPVEVKCLMQQLLCAVAHLHDNWILHRDLKASNLLLSHKGILKVGDFGLAREYGSPLKPYTPVVVTLWYRAPELLLSAKEYSTPVDMWSVGCIFAELLSMEPLFPGKSEIDQLNRIFKTLGTPNERIWPGYSKLPNVQKMTFAEFPVSQLRSRFGGMLTDTGLNLLNRFLTYNPTERITAEKAGKHEYFSELPLAIDPAMFPTWPAKSELGHRKANTSPKPPSGGRDYKKLGDDTDEGFHMGTAPERNRAPVGPGFSLKF